MEVIFGHFWLFWWPISLGISRGGTLLTPTGFLPIKFISPHVKNSGQLNQRPTANTPVRHPLWRLMSLQQTFPQAKKWLIAIDLVKRGSKASGFSVWLSNETYLAPAVYRNGIFWVTFSTYWYTLLNLLSQPKTLSLSNHNGHADHHVNPCMTWWQHSGPLSSI